jgi:RHS repeat-associated protein
VRPATTHTTNPLHAFSVYRFHFNGKEVDNEMYGQGNMYDFGSRVYSSRLGRFLSIDPKYIEYSWQSTYAYIRNNPIAIEDFMGEGDPEKRASGAKDAAKNDDRKYGHNEPGKVDCSEFTQEIGEEDGLELPRTAQDQAEYFKKSEYFSSNIKDAKIGDYIYWNNPDTEKKVDHTGVIVGVDKNGNFIVAQAQSSNPGGNSINTAKLDKNGNLFPGGDSQLNFVGIGRPKIENTNQESIQQTTNSISTHKVTPKYPGTDRFKSIIQASPNLTLGERLQESKIPIVKTLGDIISALE